MPKVSPTLLKGRNGLRSPRNSATCRSRSCTRFSNCSSVMIQKSCWKKESYEFRWVLRPRVYRCHQIYCIGRIKGIARDYAFAGRTHGADNRNKRRTAVGGIFELPHLVGTQRMQQLGAKNAYGRGASTRQSGHRFVRIPGVGPSKDPRVPRRCCKFRVDKSGSSTPNVTQSSARRPRPRSLYRKFRSDPIFQFVFWNA